MGDLSASQQTQSLVSMFDELLIQQEEARTEVHHTGPEYFLKVLEVSALTQARDSDQRREAADQILCLEREVERLQSQLVSADQKARKQILGLKQENANLQSKVETSEQLSDAQQQQILQLEREVLANQRNSKLLAEARQQNIESRETLKMLQLESQTKSRVIEEIQAELHVLRRQEEDLENHNHGICSKSLLELTKDVSVPTEDCFPVGNFATKGKMFVTSTPTTRIFPMVGGKKRRSMSLDLQLVRTPIIPGRCKTCSSRPQVRRAVGEDSQESPMLPWCPHGSGLPSISSDVSTASPTMSSALLLQPTRGAMKVSVANRLRKII